MHRIATTSALVLVLNLALAASSGAAAVVATPGSNGQMVYTTAAAGSPISLNKVARVAATCAVPTFDATGKTYYLDPVKGKITNNGSQANPWPSFEAVLKAGKVKSMQYQLNAAPATSPKNPAGVVKGGDTLLLMSGNHGNASVTAYLNDSFITVKAAPGQSPVLSGLSVFGSSKWLFSGLTVVRQPGIVNNTDILVNIAGIRGSGPVDNIVFDGNTVATSVGDPNALTSADWNTVIHVGLTVRGPAKKASCVTVTNNKFLNLDHAITLSGSKILFANNKIDHFSGDGIDFAGEDMVISKNLITNRHDAGNGDHPDGIQGFPGISKNILIDSNMVIRQTDPKLTNAGSLQGISAFDGEWHNVTLINNLVITDAHHGITWMGLNGGKIINNTVLNDGRDPKNNKTWISLSSSKPTQGNLPSRDVIVRNNASSYLAMDIKNTNLTVENNVVSVGAAVPVAGVAKWLSKPGVFGTNNRIDPTLVSGFMMFDTVNGKYDLNLKPTSPAVNFGVAKDAPLIDILGRKRDATYDAGAYTFIK